jgi:hypothetical protein
VSACCHETASHIDHNRPITCIASVSSELAGKPAAEKAAGLSFILQVWSLFCRRLAIRFEYSKVDASATVFSHSLVE